MDFWKNVNDELEYQGISRKELAFKASINEQSLHKAIERNSRPHADTAIKIARALSVSVEYLVEGDENLNKLQNENKLASDIPELTKKFISLPENQRKLILELINQMK